MLLASTTSIFTIPLIIFCYVVVASVIRNYGVSLPHTPATLSRLSTEYAQVLVISSSLLVTLVSWYATIRATLKLREEFDDTLMVLVAFYAFVMAGTIGYAFLTAVSVYLIEAIANHTMPYSLNEWLALQPLHATVNWVSDMAAAFTRRGPKLHQD